MTVREQVTRYLAEGWSVIPIPRGSKAPVEKDWTNRTFLPEDFAEDSNIGVRLGEPSGDLIDVDLDVPEAVAVAASLLLITERIHGRRTTGPSHYWYYANLKAEKFCDVDGKVICEIRSNGGQTVVPFSVHPSGESLYWEHERTPARVHPDGLRRAVRSVATAALLARHWPTGSRHYAARDFAGFLAARDLSPREIEEIVVAAATAAHDDEIEDRRRVAIDTVRTFEAGGKTSGAPSLEAHVGKDVITLLLKWYGGNAAVHNAVVDDMNRRHFYVAMGKDTVVGTERGDRVEFQREAALSSWYANQKIAVGEKTKGPNKGDKVYRTKFEIWREHANRRQYTEVVFAPPPQTARPDQFNLWRGLAVRPGDGDCPKFLQHIRDIICSGNEPHYDYLIKHLAFAVQNPGIPAEVAVVLKGKKGTGKGVLVRNFGRIFGRHFVHVDRPDQIVGHFNALCSGAVVLFADEAFADDKKTEGVLKRLITEPTLMIERKGLDPVPERNVIHLFMAANEPWVAPVGFHERRFFVLNVSDARMQDFAYFNEVQAEMDHGGCEAFLRFLLEQTVTHDDVRRVPKTDELRIQQEHSMSPELKWWKECLHDGVIGAEREWPDRVNVTTLHDAYLHWCERLRVPHRVTVIDLARRVLEPWLGESHAATVDGRRVRLRSLLPLAEGRREFDRQAGLRSPWPEELDAAVAVQPAIKF